MTVTFISEKEARGLDFKAKFPGGIDLLITNQVGHNRALAQLLGRVGRTGQPCGRYLLDKFDHAVNENQAMKVRQLISERYERVVGLNKKPKAKGSHGKKSHQ